jgi:uncharacterized protein
MTDAPNAPTESELDSGSHGRDHERLCIVTRAVRPTTDLIRFVVAPDGEVVPDLKAKLPGRGVWVTATQVALGEAIKRNLFARAFKRNVRLASDVVPCTEQLLERAALEALAMAGKAGLVPAGFGKVEAALAYGEVVALLHAAEASVDGVRKLDTVRRRPQAGPIAVIEVLSSTQLDLALGRSNVIHAALLAGASSDTFLARLRRLERFRTGEPGLRPDRTKPAADIAAQR